MDRRTFLAAGPALALAPRLAFGSARVLRLASAQQSLVGAGNPATDVWAYNGSVPGPELRFKQGERLRLEVENALGVDTTVHWHGVRVPNAMDGVPGVTQKPIAANGGRFLYEFELRDAGTYWYHPHLGSPEQVARGLYGPLIVDEAQPPAVDRDLTWMLGDWRLDREARIVEDFGNFMDASHAGRIGNTVTVNGAIRENFELRAGERVRLRLVNAANARIFALDFRAHEPLLIALDGHPVEPHRVGGLQRAEARPHRGALVPDDGHPQVANLAIQRIDLGAVGLEILVDRRQLDAAQPQLEHRPLHIGDGRRRVGIDAGKADHLVAAGPREGGNKVILRGNPVGRGHRQHQTVVRIKEIVGA